MIKRHQLIIKTNKQCGRRVRPTWYAPAANPDLWPFDLETGERVASKVGNLPSKSGNARPLGSRIIRYVPRVRRSTFGARAFAIAGPTVWNSLPDSLRDPAVGPDQFRRNLKTHLFEWHCVSFSALVVFSRNALYKSTYYLLTYLLTILKAKIWKLALIRAPELIRQRGGSWR